MGKKNILVIIADQLRKDTLGCYGNKVVNTPNIDSLADDGYKYERAYVANPICSPNRMSIFTGMNIRNHGLWTNGLLPDHERRTLVSELSDKGYETASFGKVHFEPNCEGSHESDGFWETQGDDIEPFGPYWGFNHVEFTLGHSCNPIAHYGKWFRENGGRNEMFNKDENGCMNLPAALHTSSFVGDRVSQFIREERDDSNPFFVVASFPDPHHPFDPPKEARDKYNLGDVIMPSGSEEDLQSRPDHYKQHYRGQWHRKGAVNIDNPQKVSLDEQNRRIINTYAMVDLIDENIGKILSSLKESNLMEDTMIIFTADHGELLGDHGLWYKGPFFYEGLINIPMIISAKGTVLPEISSELISSIDIAPTVCDYLNVEKPLYVDGVSQMPHLQDDSSSVRDYCLVEYRNGFGDNDVVSKALVTKEMKYVRYEDGIEELTDLIKDPCESRNRIEDVGYENQLSDMRIRLLDVLLGTETKYPEQKSHA